MGTVVSLLDAVACPGPLASAFPGDSVVLASINLCHSILTQLPQYLESAPDWDVEESAKRIAFVNALRVATSGERRQRCSSLMHT